MQMWVYEKIIGGLKDRGENNYLLRLIQRKSLWILTKYISLMKQNSHIICWFYKNKIMLAITHPKEMATGLEEGS